MKNIIVSAQIGAAGNLVKNLIMLSHRIFWPTNQDRVELIKQQYPKYLQADKTKWIDIETRLHRPVKNPFLMEFDQNKNINNNQPTVFLNHSLFWEWPDSFVNLLDNFDFVFVMPFTKFGLEWQCRSAYEKVIKPKQDLFYDFCFEGTNKQQLIVDYIKSNGYDAYERLNILNMREIFLTQQKKLSTNLQGISVMHLALEDLLLCPGQYITKILNDNFNLDLDVTDVCSSLKSWKELHWPLDSTYDWPHSIVKGL